MIYEIKDVTKRYWNMIEAFECDYNLYEEHPEEIDNLKFVMKKERMKKDIELLRELSFNLRHDKIKLIEGFKVDE